MLNDKDVYDGLCGCLQRADSASALASMATSRRQEGSLMLLSACKLLTPTLWCLLELKEGSHETGLSGLHLALSGYCDLSLGLFWWWWPGSVPP